MRRARLGLAVALTPIMMLFVSFTSAYIVRQGLPTLRPAHQHRGARLDPRAVAHTAVSDQYVRAAVEQRNHRVCAATTGAASRARTRAVHSGSIPGHGKEISVAGADHCSWTGFPGRTMAGLERSGVARFLRRHRPQQFVRLSADGRARRASARRNPRPAGGRIAVVLHRPLESRRIVVDVTAWYWHFMALLWIYILALLEFAR